VEKVSAETSDAQFAAGSRRKQIAAWMSHGIQPAAHPEALQERYDELKRQFEDGRPVPRPDHWGGYALRPSRVEFWQEGSHRLHERCVFERLAKDGNHSWSHRWLFP
jgi:pyridoxamine 5'-phosphate oxidase